VKLFTEYSHYFSSEKTNEGFPFIRPISFKHKDINKTISILNRNYYILGYLLANNAKGIFEVACDEGLMCALANWHGLNALGFDVNQSSINQGKVYGVDISFGDLTKLVKDERDLHHMDLHNKAKKSCDYFVCMNITHAEWGWNADEFASLPRHSMPISQTAKILSRNVPPWIARAARRALFESRRLILNRFRYKAYKAPIRDDLIHYAAENFEYLIISAYPDQIRLFEKIYPIKHIHSFSNIKKPFTRRFEHFISWVLRKEKPDTIDTYLSLQHVFESTISK